MKKLGLVGGTGPESTVMYYRGIINGVAETKGSEYLPEITIESLSVWEVFRICSEGKLDELADYFAAAIENLVAAGVEVAALTANTPHIVFDQLAERSAVPLISVVEATRDAALDQGSHKLGLLGTEFTMVNDFFPRPFAAAGMELVVPSPTQVAYIQDKIASELECGIATEETQRGFLAIIEEMVKRHHIERVILGCTELPLILNDDVSPVPCLDTSEIHIRAIVRAMMEG